MTGRGSCLPLLLLGLLSPGVGAQPTESHPPFQGRSIQAVLEHFRAQGYPLAYSTALVADDLMVLREPVSKQPLDILKEILRAHGLRIKQEDGIYLIIRSARGPPGDDRGALLIVVRGPDSKLLETPVAISGDPGFAVVEPFGSGLWQVPGLATGRYKVNISAPGFLPLRREVVLRAGETTFLNLRLEPAPFELEALTVSTSRYVLFSNSQFFVDQRAIQSLPGNGDDPLRAAHRLPGAAAGGWSAQTHFRGGEENETAIFLNGLRLLDPFHVRDYHNVFSVIDARAISGVEAYTGGFPAAYGDRMSGLLLLQSRRPAEARHHEVGINVFNTSLLTSGHGHDGDYDWLMSARRSNLGAVLDRERHGKPDYYDVFATLGYNHSADTRLTFNLLRARDRIIAITEHKEDDREQATSHTRNQQFWLQYETSWPTGLSMGLVLSRSEFSNQRAASVFDPEQLVGDVQDDRTVDEHGLRLDFTFAGNAAHLFSWGIETRKHRATYAYQSEAQYSGFYLAFPGISETLTRDLRLSPSGNSHSAYASDRWQASPRLTVDAGLRWDQQNYIEVAAKDQVSPRLSFLYALGPASDLRLTWGRYYQSQQIQQLQVEDGETQFYPAQRADQLIAGFSSRFRPRWSLRVEVFDKQYSRLRPRFENLLDPVPLIGELEPGRVRIAPTSAEARGAELSLEYDRDALNWWASYTHSKVTDSLNGQKQARNWDQRHSLQAGLSWRPGPWEWGLAIKAHSGWPTTSASLARDAEGALMLVPGPRNAERLNDFVNVDLRIARHWQFESSRLTAFFELNNALNRANECCVDYDIDDEDDPVLERSVDHWLGISPAIGILWEF